MPDDRLPISDLDEALELSDEAQFPYTQNNGGTLTTYKALMTQIAAKIVEDMSFAGIDLPASAGVKSVENTLNYLLDSVGGDPNGNISDSYDPTAAYVIGDLCIYENVLYICTAPTTGTFDPSKWTATTIDNVIGSLSSLTTSEKSSLVGAVNEVNAYKAGDTVTLTNYFVPCVYDASRLRVSINLPKLVRNCTFSCSFLEVYINSTDSVQTSNITNTEVQTRTPNQLWVQFTGNFTNVSNNNAGIAVISGTITFT